MHEITILFASLAAATRSLASAFSVRSISGRPLVNHRPGAIVVTSHISSVSERDVAGCRDGETEGESYVFERDDGVSSDEGATGGRFSARAFASSNCWGRRPFLMRGAFEPDILFKDDFDGEDSALSWPSWEQVVDIASDYDSESRVISHVPGDHSSFALRWGPLAPEDVQTWLSKELRSGEEERRETLVVNDIDRFYPPLADWMRDTFRFLPNWRMDDGQISLAERGGGIGPHVDNFDVFLIQMSGQRSWQVGRRKMNDEEERERTIDGLDVRVLNDWARQCGGDIDVEDWKLNPGDMLYLPPRVAHCGTALSSNCMTLSIGCRAPSVSDLVAKLAERLSSSLDKSAMRRYTDEDLLKDLQYLETPNQFSPGEITSEAKEQTRLLLKDSLEMIVNDDGWWDEFFGRYVTEQKRVRSDYPIPLDDWATSEMAVENGNIDSQSSAALTVQNVLAGKGFLCHAEGIAFAYSRVNSTVNERRTIHRFFVNGEMWQTKSQHNDTACDCMAPLFRTIANHRILDRTLLLGLQNNQDNSIHQNEFNFEVKRFLEELVSSGVLYGNEVQSFS